MATEKNPSIYYDRGTIGSSDELDEYGVWVKSEPQDLSSANKESGDTSDPFIMSLDDLPDMDEGVSLDADSDLSAAADSGSEDIEASEADISLPGIDDTDVPADEDFDINMDFIDEEIQSAVESGLGDADTDLSENSTEDGFSEISIDGFLDDSPEDDNAVFAADSLIDEDFGGLDETGTGTEEFEKLPDIDFVMSADDEESAGEDKSFGEDEAITIDDLNEENRLSLDLDDMSEDAAHTSEDTENLPDIDSALSVDSGEDEAFGDDEPITIDDIDEENRPSINFDDVAALSEDLQKDDASSDSEKGDFFMEDKEDEAITIDDLDEENRSSINFEETQEEQQQVSPEPKQETVSSELLLKIAEELSSIRKELSILKSELSSINKSEEPKEAFEPEAEDENAAGFFDKEEDEKISLTGDELDNILNTADFTEEAGEDAGVTIEEDLLPETETPMENSIEEKSEDITADQEDFQDSSEEDSGIDFDEIEIDEPAAEGAGSEDDFDIPENEEITGEDFSAEIEVEADTDESEADDSGIDVKEIEIEEADAEDISSEEDAVISEDDFDISGDDESIDEDFDISFDDIEIDDAAISDDDTDSDVSDISLEEDAAAESPAEDSAEGNIEETSEDITLGQEDEPDSPEDESADEDFDIGFDDFEIEEDASDAVGMSAEDDGVDFNDAESGEEADADNAEITADESSIDFDEFEIDDAETADKDGIIDIDDFAITDDESGIGNDEVIGEDIDIDFGGIITDDETTDEDDGEAEEAVSVPEVKSADLDLSNEDDVINEEISFGSFMGVPSETKEEDDETETAGSEDDTESVTQNGLDEFGTDDVSISPSEDFNEEAETQDVETKEIEAEGTETEENEIKEDETEEAAFGVVDGGEIILEEDIAEKDTEELKQLREEGVTYLTKAPEDISYLQEEDADNIDLSDAVIEEPDFGGIVENPVTEPSLDTLGIELDLEEESLSSDESESAEDEQGDELEISLAGLDDEEESADIDGNVSEEETADADGSVSEEETVDADDNEAEEEPLDTGGNEVGEEENFEQLIPEGFVVESDDSDLSLYEPEVDYEEESIEMIHPADEHVPEAVPSEESFTVLSDTVVAEESKTVLKESEIPLENSTEPISDNIDIPQNLKQELKTVLSYMDKLLESLPEDKIEEFARSEYFDTYKKLFEELGLV